ncbi:SusC/RagA family TonB-linked outer membrane protein [Dokdonia pacifica]|uniref:TonB-linked outer membrane protein, SusC/RagA family n=1 Tax=Dokdonia pacifica TaxID=1627892 RepID=A0A239BNI2_9FLAO|nr:TonB-dependent receptor [Dokdonia pacifica]SNS08653.1 TonB-linked outer membrane protein, SusC/RagA family [Dokdonia pacifica]
MNLTKLKPIVTLLLVIISSCLYAQQTITGTVTEELGPLPGVNILVKGTQNGTTTDFDGNYTLSNVADDAIIVFSYTGFTTKEVPVNGQTTIDIVMQIDAAALDEVIVVGFGSQSKRDVTGAISQIKTEDIAQVVTANPTSALQGKLAGVQVETAGGAPGSPANVFVRGVSSLTNSAPLYVVDGAISDNINYLNAKDIVNIQVLKDATSAAIYGSRAANGVVIVTTNRGKTATATTVNIDIRSGVNTQGRTLDLLNGPEYIAFLNQRLINDGLEGNIADPGINTDFQDLTINSGIIQDYGFNVSGGGENSRFFFSANYYDEEGLLISEDFNRKNIRLNSEFNLGKLKIQESFGFSENRFTRNNAFGNQGGTVPIIRANVPENLGGFEAVDGNVFGVGGANKFAQAQLVNDQNTERNFLGNLNFSYEIIEGLTAKLNIGTEYTSFYRNTFQPIFNLGGPTLDSPVFDQVFNLNALNDLTEFRGERYATNVEPTLNYKKSVGDHNFDVLLGGARQDITDNSIAIYAEGLPSNSITNIAQFADNIINSGGGRFDNKLFSVFGRINYNFNKKYLFTAIVRRDRTSLFSDGFNEGTFPSFSAGWVISDEDFFNKDGLFNNLKLRAGYGELGSQNVPPFSNQSVVGSTSPITVGGISGQIPGFAITSIVDPTLSFETSTTVNVGIDAALLDNDLKLSLDYFNRDNDDVIQAVAIPDSNGSVTPVFQNASSINNKGFEFEAQYHYDKGGDFTFDVGFNLSAIRNELTSSPNPIVGPSYNEEGLRANRFEVGQPLGFFFGFKTDGIYNDQAEIDNDPFLANDPDRRALLQPGDFRRVDINGDGRINDEDQTSIGNPTPDFTYGINFSANYKNWDLSAFFNGVQGNEIYNVTKFFGYFFLDDNKLGIVRNAFTPQNPNTNLPRVSVQDPAGNQLPSDFFVEDGSFLRLKTIEVGYNFTDFIGKEWVSNARAFVNVQNLFTITNYSGYDPEVGSNNAGLGTNRGFFGFNPTFASDAVFDRGLDIRAQPRPRTFTMGIQMSF